jgi:uncharacterized protein
MSLPSGERVEAPAPGQRIVGFDLARALAYFGMVYVHFKLASASEGVGPRWLAWLVDRLEGRAAATFVTLAGIGVTLIARQRSGDASGPGIAPARRLLLRRALFLLVVGLLYVEIWPADILHCYGIYLAIGSLFLAAPGRVLWATALAFILAYLPLILTLDYEAGWDWETLSYRDFWTARGLTRHLFFNGFNPVIPWTAFLLLGMWLGRQDWRSPAVRRRLLMFGLGALGLAEAVSWWLLRSVSAHPQGLDRETIEALFGTGPMPPLPLFMVAASGAAVAVIVLSVMLAEAVPSAGWQRALAATGQMALTLYVAHVVVGLGTLEALGMLKGHSVTFAVLAATAFNASSVLFAWAWRKRFARGPLEWLMRRMAGG